MTTNTTTQTPDSKIVNPLPGQVVTCVITRRGEMSPYFNTANDALAWARWARWTFLSREVVFTGTTQELQDTARARYAETRTA